MADITEPHSTPSRNHKNARESRTLLRGQADALRDKVKYPFNFSSLREGDIDPTLGKKISALISSDDDYIVYLDRAGFVQWTMNDGRMLGRESGLYLNFVGRLEAINTTTWERGRVNLTNV
jgi:hypothetical protein